MHTACAGGVRGESAARRDGRLLTIANLPAHQPATDTRPPAQVGCVARAPLTVMGATALAIGSTMLTALVSFVVAHQVSFDCNILMQTLF